MDPLTGQIASPARPPVAPGRLRLLVLAAVLTAILLVTAGPARGQAAQIVASPNPVLAGPGLRATTLVWDTGTGSAGEVWVSEDGEPEALVAAAPSGSQMVPWIVPGRSYVFRLYESGGRPGLLASVTVTAGAMLYASPPPVTGPEGVGVTAVTWDTGSALVGQVWVSADGGPEVPFAGGSGGSQAAPWIRSGSHYTFRLYEGVARERLLASTTVTTRPSIAARPNPVTIDGDTASTTIAWDVGPGVAGEVWLSANGGPEVLFAQSDRGSQEAPWIRPGSEYRFVLYEGPGRGRALALVTVNGSGRFALRLTPVASGFHQPLFVTHAGDGTGRLYVVERPGRIMMLAGATVTTFLDIGGRVGAAGAEQGLLGLAFDPGYASNRRLYVNYTDATGTTIVARYTAVTDGSAADPASEHVLLRIPQPAPNHNGGWLGFGPSGFLHVALGDGGGVGDQFGNAQDGASLLGKILRLDVHRGEPYAIPPTNPFIGAAGMRGEVWALGLRNPWRASFDRLDGALLIGDVGQDRFEEINAETVESPGGNNYGWPRMEGLHCYPALPCDDTGLVRPIADYARSSERGGDCAVTGGGVYRGAAVPFLRGFYVFGDFCSGRIWTLQRQASGTYARTLVLQTGAFTLSSFGEDEVGEIYVTGLADGTLYRIGPGP